MARSAARRPRQRRFGDRLASASAQLERSETAMTRRRTIRPWSRCGAAPGSESPRRQPRAELDRDPLGHGHVRGHERNTSPGPRTRSPSGRPRRRAQGIREHDERAPATSGADHSVYATTHRSECDGARDRGRWLGATSARSEIPRVQSMAVPSSSSACAPIPTARKKAASETRRRSHVIPGASAGSDRNVERCHRV